MKEIVVRQKVNTVNELKQFVDEAFIYAAEQFGWDKFIYEGYIENDMHVIIIKEN